MAPGFYTFGGTSAGSPEWSAITVIANQKAGTRLGFLNSVIYQIGRVNKAYPASFHDTTQGTNSSVQYDSSNNAVNIAGYSAGFGWDPTTGIGSPIDSISTRYSLTDYLIRYTLPGDGAAAIATSKPKTHPKPSVSGHMDPH